MTSIRLLIAASLSLSSASCTFHKADLWYPTVAEADAMDVQWGLSQRKPRGGPKQFYQYKSTDPAAMNLPPEEPAARTPAPAAPAPAPAASAPAPAQSGNVNLIR